MAKFIQLPQVGTAMPKLINVFKIHKIDFFNGPERGGTEILLRVHMNTPAALDLIVIKYTDAQKGIHDFWELVNLVLSTPKAKFVKVHQHNNPLPILVNENDIQKVDFYNGPQEGGREILLRVWLSTPKALDLITSKYTDENKGMEAYWNLHALLNPTPMALFAN